MKLLCDCVFGWFFLWEVCVIEEFVVVKVVFEVGECLVCVGVVKYFCYEWIEFVFGFKD